MSHELCSRRHCTDETTVPHVKSKLLFHPTQCCIAQKGLHCLLVLQLVHPLIPYSCRRKDNNKTLSYSTDQSPPPTPLQTFAFDDFPVRDIVPQRSPTASNPNHLSYSSASEDDSMYSEDEQFKRPTMKRLESEAERYLRQFHASEAQVEHSTPRPRYNRSSTALSAMSQAPSLSHSPTSTAGMSFPYTPSTTSRPLPPRSNPFSTSYKYSRSIDLVNPFAITPIVPTTAPSSLHYQSHNRRQSLKSGAGAQTSNGFAEGEMLYEKMMMSATPSPGHGSLKQLFKFNEMQAPPTAQTYARY